MNGSSTSQGVRRNLRQADGAHLALGDEVSQYADRLLDRYGAVDAVDIVEVDCIGAEPAQRTLYAGADVLGSPPEHPRELLDHNCIRYRMRGSGELFEWEFEKDGAEVKVEVSGNLTLDAPELMLRAASDGVGLAYVGLTDARTAIASGELVRVLTNWCAPTAGFHLYYPSRRHTSAALRALIDALRN